MLLLVAALSVSGCRKKPDPAIVPPADTTVTDGHFVIRFSNQCGGSPLELNNSIYINAVGDSFKVGLYKYYVTNIRLTRADDSVFTEEESYHLVNAADAASMKIDLHDVPAGSYKRITFLYGVDSLRNVSGAQTGALDVNNGMFWGWHTGYIFSKLEGRYYESGEEKTFFYHIGGFSGANNSLRWFTLDLPEQAIVSATTPEVHVTCDISEWFKTPSAISFANYNSIMDPGKPMLTLVGNYQDMFKVSHVEN